ncbi:unnamed protein product [Mesocestoides corti]|uniref:Malic_M domain-containing protein n=1 Tax=Mesocestoides corti TaxID=53468 RepID=A0A0R3UBT2_MESCO|nr:unnamed protein product [Mesocestoides corti]
MRKTAPMPKTPLGGAACKIPKVGVFVSEVAVVLSAFVGDHNVSDYGLPANPENLNAVCEAVYEKLLEVRKQFCLLALNSFHCLRVHCTVILAAT